MLTNDKKRDGEQKETLRKMGIDLTQRYGLKILDSSNNNNNNNNMCWVVLLAFLGAYYSWTPGKMWIFASFEKWECGVSIV